MQQELTDEIIADEKDINDEIFWNYSVYQNPSFLAKDLTSVKFARNKQLVNHMNDKLIALRNVIIREEIPEKKTK